MTTPDWATPSTNGEESWEENPFGSPQPAPQPQPKAPQTTTPQAQDQVVQVQPPVLQQNDRPQGQPSPAKPMPPSDPRANATVATINQPIPLNAEYLADGRKIVRSANGTILWSHMDGVELDSKTGREKGSLCRQGLPVLSVFGVTTHVHWTWLLWLVSYLAYASHVADALAQIDSTARGWYIALVLLTVVVRLATIYFHAVVEVGLYKMWGGEPYSIVLWIFGTTMKWSPIGPRKTFWTAFMGLATHAPWLVLGIIGQHIHPAVDPKFDSDGTFKDLVKDNFWNIFCYWLTRQQGFLLVIGLAPVFGLDGCRMATSVLFLWRCRVLTAAKVVFWASVIYVLAFIGGTIYFFVDQDESDTTLIIVSLAFIAGSASIYSAIGGGEQEVLKHYAFHHYRSWIARRDKTLTGSSEGEEAPLVQP